MEWVTWDVLIKHRIQHYLILASDPAPDQMFPVTVSRKLYTRAGYIGVLVEVVIGGDGYSHVFTKETKNMHTLSTSYSSTLILLVLAELLPGIRTVVLRIRYSISIDGALTGL